MLLSVSAEEQWLVYLLNRARHDPAAYQNEAGLAVDLSQIAPRPPLAVNDQLMQSAGLRSDEMAQYDYLGHQSPVTGAWPNELARDQGYALPSAWPNDTNYIESIAAGDWYDRADVPLEALIVDQGLPAATHRRHLLGVDGFYAENREIGVGLATEPDSTYGHYWTVHIARRENADVFLTGVVFADSDGNGRYDAGEGLPGVTIQTNQATATTNDAGGFSLAVPLNGRYQVLASGPGLAVPVTGSAWVAGANVEVDIISGVPGAYLDFADAPTSAWTNPRDRLDVSDNQVVDPLDALQVINYLNTAGPGQLSLPDPGQGLLPPFLDADGDGEILPRDVLLVVNYLNRAGGGGEGERDPTTGENLLAWLPAPAASPPVAEPCKPAASASIPRNRLNADPVHAFESVPPSVPGHQTGRNLAPRPTPSGETKRHVMPDELSEFRSLADLLSQAGRLNGPLA